MATITTNSNQIKITIASQIFLINDVKYPGLNKKPLAVKITNNQDWSDSNYEGSLRHESSNECVKIKKSR